MSAADRREQCLPVAAGQVDAPDRAGEEDVAGEERAVGVEGDVAGPVPGDVDHLEGDSRDVDVSPPETRCSGSWGGTRNGRASAGPQHVGLARRRPDLGARAVGEVGHARDVVDVGVRDEDRGAARPHASKLEPERRRVVARVDDDRLGRAALGAHDVAVRLERAQA